jgi:rhodanese-related sulfurtransferase
MQLPPRLRPTEAATILEPFGRSLKKKTTVKVAPKKTNKVAAKKEKEDASLTLIDVRQPQERVAGSIPGARQIPIDLILQTVPGEIPDPNAPVVVFCRSGMYGGMAQGALRKLGYTNVANIVGGFEAWKRAGLPVELLK